MRKYIRKIDKYSYIIAPKQFPYVVGGVKFYKGDEISISIKGIHLTDDKDPFNFATFDSFKAQFRLFPRSKKEYEATKDNFVLGQSEEAIEFDIDQDNPANTTMDELHFVDPFYSILSEDYKHPHIELDIEGHISSSIYTFMKFKINIKQDITR